MKFIPIAHSAKIESMFLSVQGVVEVFDEFGKAIVAKVHIKMTLSQFFERNVINIEVTPTAQSRIPLRLTSLSDTASSLIGSQIVFKAPLRLSEAFMIASMPPTRR